MELSGSSPEESEARGVALDLIAGYIGVSELYEGEARDEFVSDLLSDAILGRDSHQLLHLIAALSFFGGVLARMAARLQVVEEIDLDDPDMQGDPLLVLATLEVATEMPPKGPELGNGEHD
jgi:hypothetical protein